MVVNPTQCGYDKDKKLQRLVKMNTMLFMIVEINGAVNGD